MPTNTAQLFVCPPWEKNPSTTLASFGPSALVAGAKKTSKSRVERNSARRCSNRIGRIVQSLCVGDLSNGGPSFCFKCGISGICGEYVADHVPNIIATHSVLPRRETANVEE